MPAKKPAAKAKAATTKKPAAAPSTARQRAFCEEYMLDLNATQAAIRAGFSPKDANVQGSRLLANANVRARIETLLAARSQRTLVHADYVVNNLAEVANRCMQAVPVMVYDPEAGTMVHKLDPKGNPLYEFDSQGANKALELLGKHMGLFMDKSKNETTNKIIVQYERKDNNAQSAA